MSAHDILAAAAAHMQDRAATYDKPEGERSMNSTVLAFAAVTGVLMTEEQGWIFMALLKAVRSQQGAYRADSYEDGAAYFALAGEAAVRDRNWGWTPEAIKDAALPHDFGQQNMIDTDFDESRVDRVASSHGDGEHYAWEGAPEWAKFKAQDSDGWWCWYSDEPFQGKAQWLFSGGRYELAIRDSDKNPSWRNTLISR